MSDLLKRGWSLRPAASNQAVVVDQLLGGGGQGEVYRVDMGGARLALKWYHRDQATDQQRKNLEMLITKGAPDERFLWPLDLVFSNPDQTPGFGYLMRLRPPEFRSIVDLMKKRVTPSFRTLCTICLELADAFMKLHTRGLCYRDISFGNAFFNPDSGEVLICDNDNVTIDGAQSGGVLGTPRFMAPEIVVGRSVPSTSTDLWSLSVLLFYLLMMHHPLEGRLESAIHCMDAPAMKRLYGTEPVFIFHPTDERNHPVPGFHDNALAHWRIYPESLRKLFVQAFTHGVTDPRDGRVRESTWRETMVQLRDGICYCGACGSECFLDVGQGARQGQSPTCWKCRKPVVLPLGLRLSPPKPPVTVLLNHDTRLYPHHLAGSNESFYDFSKPLAEVAQNPADPRVWGLRNLSGTGWTSSSPDGKVAPVAPGQTVRLQRGQRLLFGVVEGEILGW